MFEFAWPWAALLLPLPLLIRLWRAIGSARIGPDEPTVRSGLLHPLPERLADAFGQGGGRWDRSERRRLLLLALTWLCFVLALMRPQWLEQRSEVLTRGRDLMLAVDGSRSMEALDFSVDSRRVSRMAVIKGVIDRFIRGREGDRIGLIVFGDEAYVLSPLTIDGEAVRAQLADFVPRMAGDGTAIGDAIGLAVKKLRDRPQESRVLVLATDGKNTTGTLPPRMAADLALHHQVRVYAIGVGSRGMVPIVEDGQLREVRMEIDEELLEEVAGRTGGAYFRATDTAALEEIYRRIDMLEKTEAETRSLWLPTPLYRWPLAAGLIPLLLLGLFPDGNLRALRERGLP